MTEKNKNDRRDPGEDIRDTPDVPDIPDINNEEHRLPGPEPAEKKELPRKNEIDKEL